MERADADRIRQATEVFYRRVWVDPELAAMRDDESEETARRRAGIFMRFALGGSALVPPATFAATRPERADNTDYGRVVDHLLASLREVGVDESVVSRARAELEGMRRVVIPPPPA